MPEHRQAQPPFSPGPGARRSHTRSSFDATSQHHEEKAFALVFDSAEPDDTEIQSFRGYRATAWKTFLFYLLGLCTLGVSLLLAKWSSRVLIFLSLSPCPLGSADYVLITLMDGRKDLERVVLLPRPRRTRLQPATLPRGARSSGGGTGGMGNGAERQPLLGGAAVDGAAAWEDTEDDEGAYVPPTNGGSTAGEGLQDGNTYIPGSRQAPEDRLLEYRCTRYMYSPVVGSFRAVPAVPRGFTQQLQRAAQALAGPGGTSGWQQLEASFDLQERARLYGANEMCIPVKTTLQLIGSEMWHPFYCFQYFSIAVWVLGDAYWSYAICIAVITWFSIVSAALETHRNMRRLADIAHFECEAQVLRGGHLVTLPSSHLVPGDLLVVSPSGTMPCDAVLLRGECIVAENMLTGESVPVRKVPYGPGSGGAAAVAVNGAVREGGGGAAPGASGAAAASRRTAAAAAAAQQYSPDRDSACTLYGGTQVAQAKGRRGSKVLALVVRTRWYSAKGQLLRSILYPRSHQQRFVSDSLHFIGFMLAGCLALYVWAALVLLSIGASDERILVRLADMVTIAVPPALPACLTIATVFSIARFKKRGIFVTSPDRIAAAGQLDVIAFDKTGTLTEQGLDLQGILPVSGGTFHPLVSSVPQLPLELQQLLASCHGLALMQGGLVGDPLDQRLFESTQWELLDIEEGDEGEEEAEGGQDKGAAGVGGKGGPGISTGGEVVGSGGKTLNGLRRGLATEQGANMDSPLSLSALSASPLDPASGTSTGTLAALCASDCEPPSKQQGPEARGTQDQAEAGSGEGGPRDPANASIHTRHHHHHHHHVHTYVRPPGGEALCYSIVKRFEFSAALQRNVVLVRGPFDPATTTATATATAGTPLAPTAAAATPDTDSISVFAKGSPEAIRALVHPSSVPPDFDAVLSGFTREGLRVLALAAGSIPSAALAAGSTPPAAHAAQERVASSSGASGSSAPVPTPTPGASAPAPAAPAAVPHWTQAEVEARAGLRLLGLAVMVNPLRPDSGAVVHELHAAGIRTAMVTGDHLQTAVSVAHLCGIMPAGRPVFLVDADARDGGAAAACLDGGNDGAGGGGDAPAGLQLSVLHPDGAVREVRSVAQAVTGVSAGSLACAVTGKGFARLLEVRDEALLLAVLQSATVYARMSPDHKRDLMGLLGDGLDWVEACPHLGLHVGFCGDGANDCGALKASHVGVSLCEAEASVAAPMTSKRQSVAAMLTVVAEGRCSLVATFQIFQFIIGYALVQAFETNIMYTFALNVGNYQYLIQDLFFTTVLAALMGYTEPRTRLSAQRPLSRVMSMPLLVSTLLQLLVVVAFQLLALWLLTRQPGYVPTVGPTDLRLAQAPENTVTYLMALAQFMILAVVFNKGRPHRSALYTNVALLVALLAQGVFLLYSLLVVDLFNQEVQELVGEDGVVDRLFRLKLLVLMLANGIVAFVVEAAATSIVAWLRGRKFHKARQLLFAAVKSTSTPSKSAAA